VEKKEVTITHTFKISIETKCSVEEGTNVMEYINHLEGVFKRMLERQGFSVEKCSFSVPLL
jgi:hypothetical protein